MIFLVSVLAFTNNNDLRLWYDTPSSSTTLKGASKNDDYFEIWQQNTIPLGNGFIGANIYGEISCERLSFNEETLWTGGPSASRPDYIGGNLPEKGRYGQTLKEIRDMYEQGDEDGAYQKSEDLIGAGENDGYGSYQIWGEIYLDFGFESSKASNYVRYLDINNATSVVQFDYQDTFYKRVYFISYPRNVLCIKLSKDGEAKLSLDVKFPISRNAEYKVANHILESFGQVEDNQLRFLSQLAVTTTGGTITDREDYIRVDDADEVVIYVVAKTDYKQIYPHYRTGESMDDIRKVVSKNISNIMEMTYDNILQEHIKDYTQYFNRVKIDLNQKPAQIPTNNLISGYRNNLNSPEEDRQLETLFFQYGRYLQLAASRENNQLPINGEGIWNGLNEGVPWSDDFHLNINLQMAYFPTYVTDLHECSIPLLEYIDALRAPGRVTASIYAGITSTEENPENGYLVHTQNTPFGWTCPGWSYDWGWGPGGGPWILHNCFEHYQYTRDIKTLKNKIYPMMKEEARFYEQFLKYETPDSKLIISSPSYSPEQGPRTNGNIYDQQIVWQFFTDCIEAAKELNVDSGNITEWKRIIKELKPPVQVGESGQIKEWFNEHQLGTIGQKGHRHMSHLLALYPFSLINLETPEWIEAAKVSLYDRGDLSTGWACSQRICAWARAGDGNHAYTIYHNLLSNCVYNNLWDSHPPFQIDGNFGSIAGVCEMIMQSHMKSIYLLPSLPDTWPTGSIDGLVARGNFKLNISWANMHLTECSIYSRSGLKCRLHYTNLARAKVVKRNHRIHSVKFNIIDENTIEFDTIQGETYIISDIPQFEEAIVPENIKCFRISSDKVHIKWTKIDDVNSYFVYRQIGSSLPELIANISEATFNDTIADEYDQQVKYYVSTQQNSVKSIPSTIIDIRYLTDVYESSPSIHFDSRYIRVYREDSPSEHARIIDYAKPYEPIEFDFVGKSLYIIAKEGENYSDFRVKINDRIEVKVNMNDNNRKSREPIYVYTFEKEEYHHITMAAYQDDWKDVDFYGFVVGHEDIISPTTPPDPTTHTLDPTITHTHTSTETATETQTASITRTLTQTITQTDISSFISSDFPITASETLEPTSSDESNSLSLGSVIGITVGIVLAINVIAVIIVLIVCQKVKKNHVLQYESIN
ncbi:hypothetical protein TRFO_25884 [Tritrichomonas foetus]|uniref:Uncharacterized protein n=1 Tax=Tritrichomonas foetus TaxID=1144522 RepID=A0A1J4K9R1_9EUKA|nr:hypothetical protein TRFO_25884 [Tritrichomonas foetus]|eukprot:OHT06181.1 hypothetical protein TRFO_25884 [Tritrichomonas foetus]